jgi:type I restriction enzyme M protein
MPRFPEFQISDSSGADRSATQLFLAADKLRKSLEPSDYKHVVLGLIFLKHISNAFEATASIYRVASP